jgi:hypothetical protein
MDKHYIAALAIVALNVALPARSFAEIIESPKDWQVQSLKGISSVKYGINYDPGDKLSKSVKSGLSGIRVPTKPINLKDDTTPLASSEGRLKIVVDDRGQEKCWVGLYLQQKSKLDRDPSTTFDADTYGIGTLCPKSETSSTVKKLCTQFVSDFNGNAPKNE